MAKKTLRLLLFEDCLRSCKGCCNKQWDLKTLPVVDSYSPYDEILLTGGEPLLDPDLVVRVITDIRHESHAPIYVYTAKVDDLDAVYNVLEEADGMTITLHDQEDVVPFARLNRDMPLYLLKSKHLRLNIFNNVNLQEEDLRHWQVKENIEWIEDCPLPDNEVFMRLLD